MASRVGEARQHVQRRARALTNLARRRNAHPMLTSGTVLACESGRAIVRLDDKLIAIELSNSVKRGDRLRGDFSQRCKTRAINVTSGTICEIEVRRIGVAPAWARGFLRWAV